MTYLSHLFISITLILQGVFGHPVAIAPQTAQIDVIATSSPIQAEVQVSHEINAPTATVSAAPIENTVSPSPVGIEPIYITIVQASSTPQDEAPITGSASNVATPIAPYHWYSPDEIHGSYCANEYNHQVADSYCL